MDNETRSRFDSLDSRVESIRIDLNGRLRALELAKAKAEGFVLGGRVLPVLAALVAAGAAWTAVLR